MTSCPAKVKTPLTNSSWSFALSRRNSTNFPLTAVSNKNFQNRPWNMSPLIIRSQHARMSTSCTVNKDAHDRCLRLLRGPTLKSLDIFLQAYKVPVFDQVSASSLKLANGFESRWYLVGLCYDDFEVNSPTHLADWFLGRLCDEERQRPYTSTRSGRPAFLHFIRTMLTRLCSQNCQSTSAVLIRHLTAEVRHQPHWRSTFLPHCQSRLERQASDLGSTVDLLRFFANE